MTVSGAASEYQCMQFAGLEPRPWPTPVRFILWAGLAVTGAVIVYYGVISASPLPDHRLIVNWNDVVLHAGAFFALTLAAIALFAPIVRVCLIVFAIGAGLEIIQLASAHHEPSLRDVLANELGVVLAWGLFITVQMAWHCVKSFDPQLRPIAMREPLM